MLTLDAFEQCLKDCFPQGLNGKKTAVALSGGLDSVVLLHLLVRAGKRAGFVPEALHIHHGLSPHADDWADFCQNYCDMLGVRLETVKVCVEKNGLGIEAAARQKRYAAFAEKGFDVLALAHHRDDQIETFMLAVARGGGLRALSAMPAVRPLGENGIIWRPYGIMPKNTVCRISRMKAIPIRLICETASGTVFCPNFRRRFPISGGIC